jgi:DME family drug/metabolite transporter
LDWGEYSLSVDRKGIALAGLVVAGWSFPGVFVRLMPQLNPWTIAVFRLSLGFLCSLPLVLTSRYRDDFRVACRTPSSWGVAVFMFAYYLLATAAFQHAPVGEVALLISSAPAVALPLRLAFGTKPTLRELAGTALALAGVACILTPGGRQIQYPSPALGPILALSAALCAASFTIGVRWLTDSGRPSSPLALSTMAQGLGLATLPLALAMTSLSQLLDHRTLWALPLGLFSTAIPTAGYAATAGRLSPVVATMLNPLVAVSANVVAALAIGEVPRIWVLPGAVLIIAGIYVATRPSPVRGLI